MTDEIRAPIVARATASEIMRMAISQGMRTLREAGIAKVRTGETTLAEVGRVVG